MVLLLRNQRRKKEEGEKDRMVNGGVAGQIVRLVPLGLSLSLFEKSFRAAQPRPRKKKPKNRKKNQVRIPIGKPGSLGGKGFFSFPVKMRRRMLVRLAKKIGEKRVVGKLRAIQVFNKNRSPVLSEKARLDSRFVASSFIKKKRVRTGTGLSRRKK